MMFATMESTERDRVGLLFARSPSFVDATSHPGYTRLQPLRGVVVVIAINGVFELAMN